MDKSPKALDAAQKLGLEAILHHDFAAIENALNKADVVITATGGEDVLHPYPKKWFAHKILVNLGVRDEYGPQFLSREVLNRKKPINFVLDDPTPIQFVDAELYVHAVSILDILNQDLTHTVHNLSAAEDERIITEWCRHHQLDSADIHRWFTTF